VDEMFGDKLVREFAVW